MIEDKANEQKLESMKKRPVLITLSIPTWITLGIRDIKRQWPPTKLRECTERD